MVDYGYGTIGSIGESGVNTIDWAVMNKGITPVFMMVPLPDEKASEAEGRIVYRDTEIVHLHIAGDACSVHSHPVDDSIKARFPEQYAHWKRTNEARQIVGTPLKMWPMASPSFIKEMEAINVFSVEDLANIADVHAARMMDGRQWRQKAESWLRAAADTALSTRVTAENEELKARIAALENRVNEDPSPVKRMSFLESIDRKKAEEKAERKTKLFDRSERMKAVWAGRKAASDAANNNPEGGV